jgi:mRNA-degrading endonuclease toxin of MazEF toxin-antitoxin module
MPSTTTYRRGQVAVVEVTFSDGSGSKPRPALVVSAETFHRSLPDIVVCPISSQPRYYRRPGPGDRPLRSWRAAGLRHPSAVRVSKLLAVDKGIVKRVIGDVAPDDLAGVDGILRRALALA